ELSSRLYTLFRILFEPLEDQSLERLRNRRILLPQAVRRRRHDASRDELVLKRMRPDQKLVEHNRRGEYVRLAVAFPAANLLRRHVVRAPQYLSSDGQIGGR